MENGLKFNLNGKKIEIYLVGAGGTGGLLVQGLSRLLYSLKEKGKQLPLTICEGDLIEEKNLLRQPFIHRDIGKNKGIVLAKRYSSAFDIQIDVYPNFIESESDLNNLITKNRYYSSNRFPVVLGCVDNAETRNYLNTLFYSLDNCIYIDSGNDEWIGQVVCGFRVDKQTILDPVSVFYPEIIKVNSDDDKISRPGGCHERVASKPQQLQTNVLASTIILGYLNNILLRNELTSYMTTFDARTMLVRPRYINLNEIANRLSGRNENIA